MANLTEKKKSLKNREIKSLLNITSCFLLLIIVGCESIFDELENNSNLEHLKSSIYADFNPLWSLYLESANGGWENNDIGRFSNDDAPAIEALLELYKLTLDERYLDKLYLLVENILNNDDIARGLPDSHRDNKILPGWSSTRYTNDNSRTIFLMDDALILIPIIKAYDFLRKQADIKNPPIYWLERAEKEFDLVFKDDWKYIDNDKGYFQDIYYTKTDLNMPMNQYAIVGELCLYLYNVTKKNLYKEYAIKTANFLKEQLIRESDGFVWYYKNPSETYPSKQYDDFSHSQLVWRFIHIMYQQNLVFNEDDIEMLKGTFKNKVISNNKVFYFFGGMLNEETPAPSNLLYKENPWLQYYYSLSIYDAEIKNILKKIQKSSILEYDSESDYNHLGLFVLLDFALTNKYLN